MIPLKYNTASQEIPLGYFVDSTDGNTEETGLTINNTDIKLWKSGATTLANKNSGGATHISNGVYYATLDATDTNTYGPMKIFVHVSGALPVILECLVMEANAYDAQYAALGTGYVEANTVQLSGDATAADNAESFFDGTGYAGTNNTIPTVTTVTTTTNVTNQVTADVTAISGDSVAADNLELDYDGTGYAKANSTIGTVTTNTDLVTAVAVRTEMDSNSTQLAAIVADTNELQTDDVPGLIAALNDPTAATIADAVWDEALAGHVAAGSYGKAVADIETDATAILADTNELQTDDVPGLIAALNDISTAQVNTEVDTALSDIGLDHLVGAAVIGTDITDDSIIAQLVSASATADWDDFDNTSDSLQAIRDRGDAAWTTGAGTGLTALASGTAQAGTASTIQLAAGETFADDELNGNVVKLTGGTGAGQARLISDYTGATDTANVTPNWTTNPDATSTYEVVEGPVNVVQIEGSDATDQIRDAVVDDATRIDASALNTLSGNDPGSQLAAQSDITGLNDPTAATIADAVLDEALSGHVAAGSLGKAVADIETDATAILADTNELQTNQGNWATATTVDLNADQSGVTVGTVNTLTGHTAQTGDNYARIGAPAGASVSADVAAVKAETALIVADTNELQGDWTNGGRLDLILDELTTQGDTNEGKIDTIDTNVDAILVDTAALNDTALPDSIPADGSRPTLKQAVYMINQFLLERAVAGTTVTVKKVDGSTSLMTLTLDDGTTPTSITRAT